MWWVFGSVLGLLFIATIIGIVLKHKTKNSTIENLNARIKAWWIMCAIFLAALFMGEKGILVLFAMISWLALREYVTLTPTRRADHRTLFWVFFVITPLQYLLIGTHWYGLFSILIPVYAFLFIPIRSVAAGETENFLERISEIQWGLMVFVYCLSYAPALLTLEIPHYHSQNVNLLLFLVIVVELSDVFQYVWGKILGKKKIAPVLSPNKTLEGFIGGILSATLIGILLSPITPFSRLQAGGIALMMTLAGFAGGLIMSAIKRERGIKDFGSVIPGHGGIIDRIDSLCFAAPLLFHLTRYFFTP